MNPLDLASYDVIVINTSAGKDSSAMLAYVTGLARQAGVLDRVVAVHADLGRAEWDGTGALAANQATMMGVRFEVVRRPQGDLLDQVEARGMWPSSAARYCTSDQKRGQVARVITALARERAALGQVRVLNCLGLRAEESAARAKRPEFVQDARQSNGRKVVDTWHPILSWTVAQVWEAVKAAGLPIHDAYALGMPRLSCVFCIFAPKAALVLAGTHNPELLDTYVALEAKIGHSFRQDLSMADVKAAVVAGEGQEGIESWTM